ncbi:hypothetical protein [Fischerella thermalis]|uniref:hypothetical protein n=1 Tax=Fischerella thermalis TaxID=372787 RepID=UPI002155ED9B|nr:hypothetical protein [Fischerella thermalis]
MTFAPPTLPPEADTHLLSGENKISPLLLDEQTSKFTIPEALLSPTNFYQTTQNDEGLQIQNPSFRQSDFKRKGSQRERKGSQSLAILY